MKPEKPLISMITVTYNAEKYLSQTLESVFNQTFDDFEYLIIDGVSRDKTLEIARRYGIDYLVSEPDKGIYDAMNKGLKAAKGEWVLFLNSDDYLYSKTVLQEIACGIQNNPNADIIYGYVMCQEPATGEIFKGNGREYRESDFKNLKLFEHPATLVRREILIKHGGFNLEYKLSADTELFMRLILAGCRHVFIDIPVTVYRFGGASSNALKIAQEYRKMMAANQKNIFRTLYFWFYAGFKFSWRYRIKKNLEHTGFLYFWRKWKAEHRG